MKQNRVLFLGPCRKIDPSNGQPFVPFAETSRSGRFLRHVVETARLSVLAEIQYANVLPGPVFGPEGQERNPHWRELLAGLDGHALWRLSTRDVVVALSDPVMRALSIAQSERVKELGRAGPSIVAAAHPSFMMRRPLAERDMYVARLRDQITAALDRPSPL